VNEVDEEVRKTTEKGAGEVFFVEAGATISSAVNSWSA